MNPYYACPSLLELEELQLGLRRADEEIERHLAGCPRCQALLATLGASPRTDDPDAVPAVPEAAPAQSARRAVPEGAGVRTGALWRAAARASADFAWVVAIIGRNPDNPDALLVAPVASEPQLATEKDLLLEPELLGYPAFLDMTNLGSVLREQLLEPVASLERQAAETMVALYRHLLTGTPALTGVACGIAAESELDPRLLEQAERAEALQELWRPAHLLVSDDEVHELAEGAAAMAAEVPASAPEPTTVLLSAVLAEYLQGAGAEWDRSTLLEASGADGAHLDGFLADRLDLTDKGDVADLSRVLHVLEISWSRAEPAVRGSLERSEGGARQAHGPDVRMAARSRRGADEQQTARDLYADRSHVDESAVARKREITSYLAELERALEDVE